MPKTENPRLLAIELENFQSIKDRTRIELTPLTFFFGPNSAGKSAILDAITLMQCFWDIQNRHEELLTYIERWQRKDTGYMYLSIEMDTVIGDQEEMMEFFEMFTPYYQDLASGFVCWDESDDFVRYEQEGILPTLKLELWVFSPPPGSFMDDGRLNYHCAISIDNQTVNCMGRADGIDIEPYKLGEDFTINYEGAKKDIRDIIGYAWPFSINPSYHDGLLISYLTTSIPFPTIDYSKGDYHSVFTIDDMNFAKFLYASEKALSHQFGNMLHQVGNPCKSLYYAFLCLNMTLKGFKGNVSGKREYIKQLDEFIETEDLKNSPFRSIYNEINTLGAKKLGRYIYGISEPKLPELHRMPNGMSYLDNINSILNSELYIDKGYQISGISEISFGIDISQNTDEWETVSHKTKLTLLDSDNTKIEFKDVGDGIAYSLPVIISSTFHLHNNLFVQQPEIHLHPALQLRVADILLKDLTLKTNTMIIETHSEHIILRVLRRIKETNTKKEKAVYPVTNEQVSCYYFKPNIDGGTEVTRQYITPDGDFMFDWPDGFFNEREYELFND